MLEMSEASDGIALELNELGLGALDVLGGFRQEVFEQLVHGGNSRRSRSLFSRRRAE